MRIAFLGLGRMGAGMAAHIVRAGHELTVWNRTPGRAGPLLELGATEAASVPAAVENADAVVLMLFGPDANREVLAQVVGAAPANALVIDSTTIGPDAAREFGETCAAAGLRYIDAPVAGTVGPARDGTLGILVGGDAADFAAAEPLLALWGEPSKIRHLGPIGAGNAAKLVVNMTLGVAMAGLGEALRLAADLGVDEQAALALLGSGPFGWTLGQKKQMLAARDASPTNFSLELLAKDLDLAVHAGERPLPVTASALGLAREAAEHGHAAQDYAALGVYLVDADRG
ncbi:MAG TPA: NAD(P)-dependent oxidoreductase [Mycobacteriales bacterium]|nr:NAD(P)-dependent oxidoreductase [Mycobacteriales bacterium]